MTVYNFFVCRELKNGKCLVLTIFIVICTRHSVAITLGYDHAIVSTDNLSLN